VSTTAAPDRALDLEGYAFAPHWIDVDGGRMHHLDEGPRGADPVLFVHGNPTWSYFWRRPVAALSDRYRCIAPDHIGCGRSDKPQDFDYRLASHVANLERLVLALDLRRVTLVVHDWGGPIGLGALLRHRERLARVVITNTAGFPNDTWGGRAPLRIRVCRTPVLGELVVRGMNAFAGMATRMAVEHPLPPAVRRAYVAPYGDWDARIATHRFVTDIPLSPAHPSYATLREVEAGLGTLDALPVAIVWGERDWCFTPAFRAEWERRLPRAEVHRIDHAGHYLLEDAPREFLGHLEGFLERHPLGRPGPRAPLGRAPE
jgi:haloalkane dehalogenase